MHCDSSHMSRLVAHRRTGWAFRINEQSLSRRDQHDVAIAREMAIKGAIAKLRLAEDCGNKIDVLVERIGFSNRLLVQFEDALGASSCHPIIGFNVTFHEIPDSPASNISDQNKAPVRSEHVFESETLRTVDGTESHFVGKRFLFTGHNVLSADIIVSPTGEPEVHLALDDKALRAIRGLLNRQLAVVVNGRILVAPVVEETKSAEIAIRGTMSLQTARQLVAHLSQDHAPVIENPTGVAGGARAERYEAGNTIAGS